MVTNKIIKEVLNISIIIVLLAGSYGIINFVGSYTSSIEPSSFRSFSVSGEGKAVAIPDIAEFNFSVITQGNKNISEIQTENTNKTNTAINFLKNAGVDEKDIKTQNYSLDPQYQYYECRATSDSSGNIRPCPPPQIVGYTITQTISVKIRDFKKIGDILSGIVKSGANSVSQLSFKIDNDDLIKSEARDEAISKAKEKAKEIADAGGFKLGRLLSIEESGTPQPIYYAKSYGMGGIAADTASVAPSIQPGSQEVSVNIILKYEIK